MMTGGINKVSMFHHESHKCDAYSILVEEDVGVGAACVCELVGGGKKRMVKSGGRYGHKKNVKCYNCIRAH